MPPAEGGPAGTRRQEQGGACTGVGPARGKPGNPHLDGQPGGGRADCLTRTPNPRERRLNQLAARRSRSHRGRIADSVAPWSMVPDDQCDALERNRTRSWSPCTRNPPLYSFAMMSIPAIAAVEIDAPAVTCHRTYRRNPPQVNAFVPVPPVWRLYSMAAPESSFRSS